MEKDELAFTWKRFPENVPQDNVDIIVALERIEANGSLVWDTMVLNAKYIDITYRDVKQLLWTEVPDDGF